MSAAPKVRRPERQALYWLVAGLVVFSAFPFFWMVSTSFKPMQEIFVYPPTFLPQAWTLENFARLFDQTRFVAYFVNSVVVALEAVAVTMIFASAGAYGLTRFRFPGRELIANLILLTYMFAPIMIIIPFYVLMKNLGITNTHLSLVLSYTALCLPFALWMLRSFFQGIPLALEEAALIDGASRWQAVVYVIFPLALPGLIATSIFTFILAWNEYVFVRILISSDELKTLPVGIADLYNATVTDWGMIMAGGLLITVPVLIFFMYIQRYLVAGWGAGGMKG